MSDSLRRYGLPFRLGFGFGLPLLAFVSFCGMSMWASEQCGPIQARQSVLPGYAAIVKLLALAPQTWFAIATVAFVIAASLSYLRRSRRSDIGLVASVITLFFLDVVLYLAFRSGC
jgi:hypothetical protein